jgi:hypothetical protein
VACACEHINDIWGCIHYWEYLYVSEDLTLLVKLGLFVVFSIHRCLGIIVTILVF